MITCCIEELAGISDKFGDAFADSAVLHVIAICVREKRATDSVARLASDKLGLLLPHTTAEEAVIFAGRLRNALAYYPLYFDELPVRLRVTLGVAEANSEMSGIAALLKAAEDSRGPHTAEEMPVDRQTQAVRP